MCIGLEFKLEFIKFKVAQSNTIKKVIYFCIAQYHSKYKFVMVIIILISYLANEAGKLRQFFQKFINNIFSINN
jgi:hypothetical protein